MIPERVIAATDFSKASERAVALAGKLAIQFGAPLSLLHVFEIVAHHRYQIPVTWMIDAIRKDIKQQLFQKVKDLENAGIEAQASLLENGVAPVEILKYLECHKGALVVMGTHARSGMERFLLGSTAEEVLRHAPCPAVTVGPHVIVPEGQRLFRKLLYAVDCSPSSLSAIPLVHTLCRTEPVEFEVLHVANSSEFQPTSEDTLFNPFRRALAERGAVKLQPEYVTLHGKDVSQGIVNEAERFGADLIVLGVHRGGLCSMRQPPKITFQVIAAAACAVLTVSSEPEASTPAGSG